MHSKGEPIMARAPGFVSRRAVRPARRRPVRPAVEFLEHRRLLAASDPDLTFGGHDGVINTSIAPDVAEINDLLVLPDGKTLVVGGGDGKVVMLRYNADGSVDTSFGNGGKVVSGVDPTFGEGRAVAAVNDGSGRFVVA